MDSNFNIIENKLNSFISKFYSNKLYLGIIFFIVFAIVSLFIFSFAESYFYFSPLVKTFIFYSLIFILISDFIFFILFPLLKILRVFPVISFEEASSIISNYFADSKDILLNLIQLNNQSDNLSDSNLLIAGINQKVNLISPLNFTSAINFKKTFKFLLISLSIIFLISLISSINFDRFSKGAIRFINYSTFYQPENPYNFNILNKNFELGRGEDYQIFVSLDGPSIPNDVFINFGSQSYRMNVDSLGFYSYSIKNVSSDINFNFKYLDYFTENYSLKVFDKPYLENIHISVVPPQYTNLQTQEFDNLSNIVVPHGSLISWNFDVQHVENLIFKIDSIYLDTVKLKSNQITYKKSALKDFNYQYSFISENNLEINSSVFNVEIIPDNYPNIEVSSLPDSTSLNSMFFSGRITDDFGFKNLKFIYYNHDNPKQLFSNTIEINHNSINQEYFYYFDFSNFKNQVDYYFEVTDNDVLGGYKSSKTSVFSYKLLTKSEKEARLSDLKNSIYDKINESQSLLNSINKDLAVFQKSVSGNNNLSDYEKQLKIDNLVEKQQKLEELLKEISDNNFKKDLFQNQENNLDQDILDQQKQMQDLWKDLMNDDIKDLLNQINKLKDSLHDRNLRDNIDNLKFDFSQINEQLERNNQLLKYYDVENKLNNLTKDLNEFSKDYEKFSRETLDNNFSDNNNNKSDFSEKSNDFKEKFDKLQSDYEKLMDKNSDLDEMKMNLDSLFDKFNSIKNDIDNQIDKLEQFQNNDSNFSKSDKEQFKQDMQNTSEDIQEMSNSLNGNKKSDHQKKNSENLNDVRQILDNLVSLSFSQENIIIQSKTSQNSATFIQELLKSELNIKRDFDLVKDSIYALAKREPDLGHSVYSKIDEINSNFNSSISKLKEGTKSSSTINQQLSLTGINDLALIFSEIEQNMQQQMQNSQSGEDTNEAVETKNKKRSQQRQQQYQQAKSQQQSLKQSLEKMLQQLQRGDNPQNQQLVETLKMQELMQQYIQELMNNSGSNPKNQQLMKQINQLMEQNKNDILNKRINQNLINRQNQIYQKLLDCENAEKSQEQEDNRESKSGKDKDYDNTNLNFPFINKERHSKEFINKKYLNIDLFYLDKYNDYIKKLN
ncbi:MAG: hypothetical protein MJ211_02565 [Bacteroidales bacterium]|nr:hypothetical protein [Bacteroidales bacterium]